MITWPWLTPQHRPAPARRRSPDETAARLKSLAAIAYRLDRYETRWHVYASPSLVALVAMPLWDPGERVILTATTSTGLQQQMRQAEAEAARRPPRGTP